MRSQESIDRLPSGVLRRDGQRNHTNDALALGAGLLERFGELGKGGVWNSKLLPISSRPEGLTNLSGGAFVENVGDHYSLSCFSGSSRWSMASVRR